MWNIKPPPPPYLGPWEWAAPFIKTSNYMIYSKSSLERRKQSVSLNFTQSTVRSHRTVQPLVRSGFLRKFHGFGENFHAVLVENHTVCTIGSLNHTPFIHQIPTDHWPISTTSNPRKSFYSLKPPLFSTLATRFRTCWIFFTPFPPNQIPSK